RYALQLLNHWVQSHELVDGEHGLLQLEHASENLRGLPSGVSELLQTRLGRLLLEAEQPQLVREVLGRAALAGRRFTVATLERVFELESRADLAAEFDNIIERMLAEDFWDEVDDGTLQFSQSDLVGLAAEHFVST